MNALSFETQKRFTRSFDAIRHLDAHNVLPIEGRLRADITRVKAGGFITINGLTYRVEKFGRYDEWNEKYTKKKPFKAFELRLLCIETGEYILVEHETEDDELAVCQSVEQTTVGRLRYDDGEEFDTDDMDTICDKEWEVVYRGKTYWYDDDWAAKYHQNCEGEGEEVYFYDFKADDGEMLTIEEWKGGATDDDYEVWISRSISPDSIEVIAVEG